jgi:hypothetical protein
MLVLGQYAEVARLTNGARLSAAEIESAARQYPFALQSWPIDQSMFIEAIEVVKSHPRSWNVRADAFTLEERRSDLSLELTLTESSSGSLTVEFDDRHVL